MSTPPKPKRKPQPGTSQRMNLRLLTLAVMGAFVIILALLAIIITTRPPPPLLPTPTLDNPQPNHLRIELTSEALYTQVAATDAAKTQMANVTPTVYTTTPTVYTTLPPTWTPGR